MQYWKYSNTIINWQHMFGRNNLPWQKKNNPYYIWISEIMLQQTQVNTVIPYFNKFIQKFQNIKKLSEAHLNQILYIWSGLGYYARAKNIHKTAQIIQNIYHGKFPNNIIDLIKLPGIGKTTAGAILSFSYNFSFPILDANVKRILIRFYNISIYQKKSIIQHKLWKIITYITPIHNTNKFNQGMMDLGAMICHSQKPKCNICPIHLHCKYYKNIQNQKNIIIHQPIIKKIYKKKILFFIIIQKKNLFFLKKIKNQKIWNNLFCFPQFTNLKKIHQWLLENKLFNIKYQKYKYIYHTIGKINFKMIFLIINIKNKIFFKKKKYFLYNIKYTYYIGIPSPIKKIILNLKKI